METLASRPAVVPFPPAQSPLGTLDQNDAARLIVAATDVSLIIDRDGVIRDVAFGNEEMAREDFGQWVGRAWIDTVTVESRGKVEDLLREAGSSAAPRWRHVNHPCAGGPDVPVRYSAVQVGSEGRVVAVGRDLRTIATLQRRLMEAQQSMEREYTRLRSSETRYRMLFQIASEAVLIVDAATERVVEANPVADRLLGRSGRRVFGRGFADFFEPASLSAIQGLLATAKSQGRADDIQARIAGGAGDVAVAASLFRQENSAHILVRLTPRQDNDNVSHVRKDRSTLLKVVEKLPDGFVVTDPEWKILTANSAFLDLAQVATEELACAETLDRFLGRTEVEFAVMGGNLREHGSIRQFSTQFRSKYGSIENVEVTAVSVPDSDTPCFGFSIRTSDRRMAAPAESGRETPRSVEQLTELVGRVSLKDLVRESTDLIERLAIEAALELTGDNRASAADMLGLSRQSLYVKLRRYGLGDLEAPLET